MFITATLNNPNQNKEDSLNAYLQSNERLIKVLLKQERSIDEIIKEFKLLLPLPIIEKTINLVSKGESDLLLPKNNSSSRLILSNKSWKLYKKGKYFSILIPLLSRKVKLPIQLKTTKDVILLNNILEGKETRLGDLCIHNNGLDWEIIMCINKFIDIKFLSK